MLPSYGRRRGRALKQTKQQLWDELLPKLSIALPGQGPLNPAGIFPANITEYWLEIGFGGGEHMAHQAGLYRQAGIIGCEPYVNGIAGLLAHIEKNDTRNIRIFSEDARLLMEKLPSASISKAFILYPDPWPKARHKKRRLVSTPTLNLLARIMKSGAELRLATDDDDYCTWMLGHLLAHPEFSWRANTSDDWLNAFADWISTRYEKKKAFDRGLVPSYLNFNRR
ncbi:MAG: tRNA (guanosine(46)-N7)-methyltransferase TrmB [Proteobacteria bacterium]|nr:tRNA (guanosine(46)-N7)-methyltransferase TrmB [Pseudomonadota bacterium]